jgi:uncharacterized protein YbjT (DUF2867 family)
MKRALVIGATGNIGRHVVAQLSAAGAPVRAMMRKPCADGLPAGVEVAQGDLSIPESLDACLDGTDAVFLVWTAPAETVGPALERIARRARRIVFLSAPFRTPHPMFQRPQPNGLSKLQAEIERRIEASGVEWTFVRPGMIAMNARFWWGPQIRAGDVVRWPCAAAVTAPIHEADIAAVAVRALCDEGHAGADYIVTGPEALSHVEQVATVGRAIGRTLRFEEISPDEARRELLPMMPEFVINMLLMAWGGATEEPPLITSTVAAVTGAPPRTFFAWARDNVSAFRA